MFNVLRTPRAHPVFRRCVGQRLMLPENSCSFGDRQHRKLED
jgi:hypothetical protein